MTPGRNNPCHCGSGRKYKRCCLAEDRAREADAASAGGPGSGSGLSLSGEVLEAARDAAVWEADLFPMPVYFDDEPDARPGMCLISSGGFVVHQELIAHPVNEIDEVAGILGDGILEAERRLGKLPLVVEVLHAKVADALADRFADRGLRVRDTDHLPGIDEVGRLVVQDVAGVDIWPTATAPMTWKAWGHPPGLIARIFREAAAFYRAEPWRALPGDEALSVFLPDGREWTAAVMGAGGQEFGLALYDDPRDLFDALRGPMDFPGALRGLRGATLSLTFDRAGEIPRPMRKEVARAGWTVAAPSAYPVLMAMNTPGGGISRRAFDDLSGILGALGRLAEVVESGSVSLETEEEWLSPETEILVAWDPPEPSLWTAPDRLTPAGPEGPGAEPDALLERWDPETLEAEHEAVLDAFARHLDEEKGFSAATVNKHTENAWLFLHFLSHLQAVPLRAVHEMHLRLFLFDWCIRKVQGPETQQSAIPVSLKRFFAFLEEEGTSCPWAGAVLGEREAYRERRDSFPGGFFWSPGVGGWVGTVWADLERRVLAPDPRLGEDGDLWEAEMGPDEATLQEEVQRRWLLWRDELIREGVDRPGELDPLLIDRQREWERSPHPEFAGQTPVEVVQAERATREER